MSISQLLNGEKAWADLHVHKLSSTSCSGVATLVAGAATVACPVVSAGSSILLSFKTAAGSPGVLSVGAIVDGVSFDIADSGVTASSVSWVVLN